MVPGCQTHPASVAHHRKEGWWGCLRDICACRPLIPAPFRRCASNAGVKLLANDGHRQANGDESGSSSHILWVFGQESASCRRPATVCFPDGKMISICLLVCTVPCLSGSVLVLDCDTNFPLLDSVGCCQSWPHKDSPGSQRAPGRQTVADFGSQGPAVNKESRIPLRQPESLRLRRVSCPLCPPV